MRGHFAAAAAAAAATPIGGLENGPEAAESCQEGQTRQMEGWMDSKPRVLLCRFGSLSLPAYVQYITGLSTLQAGRGRRYSSITQCTLLITLNLNDLPRSTLTGRPSIQERWLFE